MCSVMKKRNKMEVEADQVHVEGDRGRDVRPVLQVAEEAHGNVQAAERGGEGGGAEYGREGGGGDGHRVVGQGWK